MTRRCALGALAAALAALASGCDAPRAAARPDVILIMIDTLRPDHLGSFGYGRDTSPAIDRFAAESLRFENAYAHAPVTRISVATLLTGLLPHETGILDAPVLPRAVDTLAERLARQGYRTEAVIGNYVLRAGRGYEQGFERYDDEMSQVESQREWPERIAEHTTGRAIERLEQAGDQPLFLWIVYQDPHGPYTPPYAFAERFLREDPAEPRTVPLNDGLSGRGGVPSYQQFRGSRDYHAYVSHYDGEIRYLDGQLRRLFDALKVQGRWDDALIVLTSDHGEGMGEHDYYFAHGEYLYEDQIRVPLVLRHGAGMSGVRRDRVRLVDVAATILAAAGLPPDPRLRGRDLREPRADGADVFAAMQSPLVADGDAFALVRGGYKLIHTPGAERWELYDLIADPSETTDLADDPAHAERRAEIAAELARLLALERARLAPGEAPPALGDDERRLLEALGYLEER